MKLETSRRNFLKQSVLASAALALPELGARAGSPKGLGRAAAPRKVIVIGAGLAGLSAAFELTQAGHDVTVLEARTRPGGRVQTLREPFSGGLYAEAGAIRIDDHHNFTLKYVKLFDLPTVPPTRSPADAAITYYLRNTLVKLKAGEKPVWPLGLTEEEKAAGLGGLWRKYLLAPMKEAGGDPTAWPPATLLKYDSQSFTEFMRQRGASPAAAELLSLGLFEVWGNGLDSVSAPLLLREAALVLKTRQTFTIKGGNDLLPKAFASRLEEKILYGVPVVRIEHDPQRVRVHFMQAGARQTLEADHLVCAIPFSVLKSVEVAPRLSAEKQRAVEQLPYTSVSRVYLQSRKKFWLDAGVAGGSLTDLPIMEVIESDGGQTGPRSILESYTVGDRSRRIEAMKEGERIRFTLDQMEKVHPGMRANFEGGASKCWDEDEWSRGAYIWYKPGQMSTLLPAVSKPEGRIHFAGEHTSSWPATMQGALESGNRAAQEINEAP